MSILTQVQKNSLACWQNALKDGITDPAELLKLLDLDDSLLSAAEMASKSFKLRVPRRFAAKIRKNDLNDPILRQILPIGEELVEKDGFSVDPLAEIQFNPVPGLLHKYHGRVLLPVVSGCGVNCRYCFRRHFPYAENNISRFARDKIFQYIQNDASIQEVIYSGGDPLVADDDYLKELTDQLFSNPQLKRLRIHSRMPVILPERITPSLLNWLVAPQRQSIIVLHCNHPQELDAEVARAVTILKQAGVTVLNQAVLLRGINDTVDTQVNLSEALFDHGILPYYLHILDQVQGAAHFEVPLDEAKQLYREMQKKLPGFLMPRLAREEAGAKHKVLYF